MLPFKSTVFEANPPDFDAIQSELDHWKNLTFSFDMGDEHHNKAPSEARKPSSSAHDEAMQDAVLLAQFAEATRSRSANVPAHHHTAPQQNIPLDPSVIALAQALQAVQSQGFQPMNFSTSHPFQDIRHGQQQHPSSFDISMAVSQLLQSSGNSNGPSFPNQYSGHSAPQTMNNDSFFDQFHGYDHSHAAQSTAGTSFAGSGAAVASSSSSPPNMDDNLDDKRTRNTAASARFRIKKKQRTLNLERSVSDLKGRAEELEREATDLRRENGWLKEIIMLKSSRLNLTPDTVSSSMWDGPSGSGEVPEEKSDEGDLSDPDYVDRSKKGKGKATKK